MQAKAVTRSLAGRSFIGNRALRARTYQAPQSQVLDATPISRAHGIELSEPRRRLEQRRRSVELDQGAVLADGDAVAVADRLEPVRDADHGAVLEFFLDGFLDFLVRVHVDAGFRVC